MGEKWVRMLFRRRVFVVLLLLLQVALMVSMVYSSGQTYRWVYNILNLVSLFVVLHVISTGRRASYKLLWSVMILIFPLFGGLLYVLVRLQDFTMVFKKHLKKAAEKNKAYFHENQELVHVLGKEFPDYEKHAHYLVKTCGFRGCRNETISYLTPGEEKFRELLLTLEQAEHFIFMEYFIIQEGKMWNPILEILKKKAAEGVDVRLIYDDLGCFMLLPLDYQKKLEAMGIRCVVFNKFRPALSTLQNHRDHRKIAVIDGKWAFCGGVNLADEYINEKSRFGHWKDAAVKISGEAVGSFTLMFLEMWQALTGQEEDFGNFVLSPGEEKAEDGFIIPYCDSPVDKEYVSEQVYLNMIGSAKQYLYIQSPYLILDDSMVSALISAAKNGVDVRIMTPGVADKWYVHMTTQSYYRELILGGVKIYEYAPGFLHSKVMAADDLVATVGTVNLDFRSLYLHFECGAWLCGSEAVPKIRQDFMNTLGDCKQIAPADCRKGFFKTILQEIFRLFAPLM